MRVVVDTNVIAYHLLGTEKFQRECGAFGRVATEPVATFDAAVLRAFPSVACRPGTLISR